MSWEWGVAWRYLRRKDRRQPGAAVHRDRAPGPRRGARRWRALVADRYRTWSWRSAATPDLPMYSSTARPAASPWAASSSSSASSTSFYAVFTAISIIGRLPGHRRDGDVPVGDERLRGRPPHKILGANAHIIVTKESGAFLAGRPARCRSSRVLDGGRRRTRPSLVRGDGLQPSNQGGALLKGIEPGHHRPGDRPRPAGSRRKERPAASTTWRPGEAARPRAAAAAGLDGRPAARSEPGRRRRPSGRRRCPVASQVAGVRSESPARRRPRRRDRAAGVPARPGRAPARAAGHPHRPRDGQEPAALRRRRRQRGLPDVRHRPDRAHRQVQAVPRRRHLLLGDVRVRHQVRLRAAAPGARSSSGWRARSPASRSRSATCSTPTAWPRSCARASVRPTRSGLEGDEPEPLLGALHREDHDVHRARDDRRSSPRSASSRP